MIILVEREEKLSKEGYLKEDFSLSKIEDIYLKYLDLSVTHYNIIISEQDLIIPDKEKSHNSE